MALDPKYKAVGFDMDGTFMRTEVDYSKLANVMFDEMVRMGVPESVINRDDGFKFKLDSGMNWLIANGRGADIHAIRDRVAERSTAIEMENANVAVPFDGAVEVLELLKKKNYKVGILTRGGHSYAEYILKANNLLERFDAVIARDDFPEDEAKPSPKAMVNLGKAMGGIKAEEILFLGDHKFDWLTARDSGAGFYGVLSGGYDMKDWKDTDADIMTIPSVRTLLDLI